MCSAGAAGFQLPANFNSPCTTPGNFAAGASGLAGAQPNPASKLQTPSLWIDLLGPVACVCMCREGMMLRGLHALCRYHCPRYILSLLTWRPRLHNKGVVLRSIAVRAW